jgi:hypothetical protein
MPEGSDCLSTGDTRAMIPRLTWVGTAFPPIPHHLLKLAAVHA